MIDTPRALDQVIKQASEAGLAALDTEFVWERTYYPALAVVQLGLPDGSCHLLDVLALDDLSPLGQLLADADVVKILHDAPQDLTILRQATDQHPRRVFDTRLAAGFAGLGSTLSLNRLVQQVAGVDLPKTEQRSKWLRRPLTAAQVTYAENDVRYLPAVRQALLQQVEQHGNGAWLQQELDLMDDPAVYAERDPRQQYLRVKGVDRLDRGQLAVLRELAAFREQQARQHDLPRAWLLTDKTLLALTRRQPTRQAQLEQVEGLSSRTARNRGKRLLSLVAQGLALTGDDRPPLPKGGRRRGGSRDGLDAAAARLQDLSHQRGIDPALVASQAELKALLRDGRDATPAQHRLLRGWRGELVGRELVQQATGG